MPSLIDIRRRVRAVKSTRQITKAMKMISASRLRRAQERVTLARPFAQQMLRVLNSLATRVEDDAHPLLAQPVESSAPVLLIVITADRGLCGSFNTNVIKGASNFAREHNAPGQLELSLIGRKGRDFFRRRGFTVQFEEVGIFSALKYSHAQNIARSAMEAFTSGKVSAVYLVYNEFKSVIAQKVVLERLLPIPRLEPSAEAAAQGPQVDYLYEPSAAAIFGDLLPRHVEVQVYRALLESAAAEHAARMTAMDTAVRNSSEMIDALTLYMNKVRQAAITREIIEVVSGAQAL
jgi:F-type H+-transporting ATPase subunit gamma